ncbi:hypothetical protein EDD21DRAFT_13262 [Dissophora ornata]|nr:hypothetical protein EDD21DRAFT_13262 [Dissophora ornata]
MDDIESYGDDDLAANVYDDNYLSSDGENVADVTIDLLEDEEFPDLLLDHDDMSNDGLTMNTYEHEFQVPQKNGRNNYDEKGGDIQSHLQKQLKQPQQQQLSQRNILQQQQSSEPERVREPVSSKSSRDRVRDPDRSLKSRKPEVTSRLPMPKSFQQQSSSNLSSSIPTSQHRPSYSGASGRSNSSNTSPPIGSKTREPKPSPSEMATSPGMANDYISQKGSGSSSNNVTPNAGVGKYHPSVNTKHGHSSSVSSNNNNGPASAGSASGGNNNDLNNVIMASPTSPKVALVLPSAGGNNNSITGGGSKNWSAMEMDEFLLEHRNQLRDCGELTKRETKLLANVTLGMSSPVHAQSTGFTNSRESFMKYVDELDEIVDEKLITIVAMSRKLKALREQA